MTGLLRQVLEPGRFTVFCSPQHRPPGWVVLGEGSWGGPRIDQTNSLEPVKASARLAVSRPLPDHPATRPESPSRTGDKGR
jgi:hypothetical protein